MRKDVTGGKNPPEVLAFINRADTHHAVREPDEAEDDLLEELVEAEPTVSTAKKTSTRKKSAE